jgi:ribosomal protein S6E (S10)
MMWKTSRQVPGSVVYLILLARESGYGGRGWRRRRVVVEGERVSVGKEGT